jgi:gamma-glutamylcyclotransferase (GGCT)/AIG2-like uncharacterized protein YtfP
MKTLGVYGSLKEGCYNYERWGLNKCKRLENYMITGAMRMIGNSYPALYKIGDAPSEYERIHDLELYEVPDWNFDLIESMEINAGYYPQVIHVGPHNDVIVFLMSPEIAFKPETFIEKYPV